MLLYWISTNIYRNHQAPNPKMGENGLFYHAYSILLTIIKTPDILGTETHYTPLTITHLFNYVLFIYSCSNVYKSCLIKWLWDHNLYKKMLNIQFWPLWMKLCSSIVSIKTLTHNDFWDHTMYIIWLQR